MKKITKILIIALCGLFLTATLIGCGGGDNAQKYSITVEATNNGEIELSSATAKEGASITVTAKPAEGYMVESITLNGEYLPVADNKASFTMPASNVSVGATFVKDLNAPIVENIPTIVPFSILSKASRQPQGSSSWSFAFAQTFTVNVWVRDAFIFGETDGIRIYFGLKSYNRELSEENIMVEVFAGGAVKTYKVVNGEFVASEISGINAYVQQWSTSANENAVGYKVTLKIEYQALGVTADSAKGNITFLPMLLDKNMESEQLKQNLLSGDYVIEKPHTYPLLTNDDGYTNNPLATLSGQLGSSGDLEAGVYWDTEKDYFPEEENYANRVAILTNHDNADNNIYFYNTANAKQMYVEATFKVTKVTNVKEQYGKFGLMLFNGSPSKGLFFYADTYIGESSINIDNIKGTELGYAQSNGEWTGFVTIADTQNSFDLATKTVTLKLAYKDGRVYMYCGDKFVMARDYNASNPVIGIKSFGYGLEVTNYYSTIDATDAKLIAHTPSDISKQVEVLLVGDNYVANWTGYRKYNVAGGISNEGAINETADSLVGKISSLKENYRPNNIVVNVGINDVAKGNTAATIIERIKNTINAYHTAFPQAKVHFVSILPSPMYSAKLSVINEINAQIKALATTDGLLEYIDVASVFMANGSPRPNMFAGGGFVLNNEFGYPLWGSTIAKALGIERVEGTQFGDNAEGYAYSDGWSFKDGGAVAVNSGTGEQVIWYKGLSYSADLYFEAKIYSPENTGADAWPKAGLALRNDEYTIFAYIDLASNADQVGMNIVYRPNGGSNVIASGDWMWQAYEGQGGSGASVAKGFVTIGIAKLNSTVYMLCNGEIVAVHENIGIDAEDEFVVGALNFNRRMEIKEASSESDKMQIANILGVEIIPEVDFADVAQLGGSENAHNPANLTYTVTQYYKAVTVNNGIQNARMYVQRTGAYIITVNGNEVKELPVIMKLNGATTLVHDLSKYLTAGSNNVAILTADAHTTVKAKIALEYVSNNEYVVTDGSWASESATQALDQKPTFYFLGSSVTYGSATNGISFVENVKNTLGYNVVKEAVSGTTLVDGDSTSYVSRMKTLPTDQAVTRLVVQLSTNDVSQGKPFGALAEGFDINTFNTSTVIGAIEYIIAYAKQTWNCEVVFYTNHKYGNASYNSLIGELYKVQAKWGIGIVDFFNYVDMEELSSDRLASYKADDIHPNVQGYVWMGEVFSEYLQNEVEKDVLRKYVA